MQIELPQADEIRAALPGWRAVNPVLDRLSAQYPNPGDALRRFGLGLLLKGHNEPALGVLKAALAFAPDATGIWNDLAGAFYRCGDHAAARAAQRASLDRDPAQPRAWLLLGAIDSAAGDTAAAEASYLTALELDAHLAEAAFGLGVIRFQERRFSECAALLRQAVADGCNEIGLYVCLGQALFLLGDFAAAVTALESAARLPSSDGSVMEKLAQLKLIEGCVRADVETAMAAYRKVAGTHARDIDAVAGTAFHFLSGFGYREAAIALGQWRLARNPQDRIQRYLLAALRGEPLARAPDDYLVAYFDGFAETFESKLVDALGYDVPQKLYALLAGRRRRFADILDLGCGTGLCAPFLRKLGDRLTGVDLSRKMLRKAADRALYDALVESEACNFLDSADQRFDLVVAADVLIYFGALAELFAKIARRLAPGGLFAFNIETAAANFQVLPSGRFAHAPDYVAAVAASDFCVVDMHATRLRLEAAQSVAGTLVVLERR